MLNACMEPVDFLAAVRARLIRVLVIEGVARVLAIVVTAAVLAVAADWVWRLPGLVRFGLLLAVTGAAGLVVWVRLGRPFRRDLGNAALARFAERRVPELDGRLLTQVEGIAMGDHDRQVLGSVLASINPATLIPARRTPKQVFIGAAAVLAVIAVSIATPETAADGAQRLLLPLGSAEWRKHTSLSATLEHAVVPADGAVVLAITRHHPDADFSAPVVVSWKGGVVDESRQLGGLTGSSWSTSIPAPVGTYEVTISSADAEPVVVQARVVARPTVGRIRAMLTPPAYTGLPTQTVDTVAGTMIPGTKLAFSVGFITEAGRQIATASARFNDTDVTLTEALAGKSQQFSGEMTVLTAGSLALTAVDHDGIALTGAASFPLTITPDRPPVVSLSGPSPREAVTVRAVVELSLAASDDFGLADLSLTASTVHGDSGALPEKKSEKQEAKPAEPTSDKPAGEILERFTGVSGQPSVNRTTQVEVGRHAAEGEQLVLVGRAHDRNDVSGPGVGTSEALSLRVVPEDLLRQELDRLLGEAKERVSQARDDLASAQDEAARARHLRAASQATAKADELLVQVLRRWGQNRMAPEGIIPGTKARTIISEAALPKLAEATAGADAPRQAADVALAEAERLLASMLQEGDLTRLLTSLIAREGAIATETRGFVKAYLTKALDPAGKVLQQNLATRQRELADQALDIERRLLAKEGATWAKAQDLVRKEAPGDRLRQASGDLATNDRRNKAVDGQQAALATLTKLLDALRGGDAAHDLAAKLGQLAAEQEQVAKDLERGAAPGSQAAKQKDLAERTAAASREAANKDDAAAKTLAGAVATQESAERGMKSGDAGASARDANAAAGLLREAQKQLGGDQKQAEKDKEQKDPKDDKKPDVIALLKELRTLQAALVTDATLLSQKISDQKNTEKALDFAAQRQVLTLAGNQADLLLRLKEEALSQLDKNPIARVAVERVATAMDNAHKHLATPALGAKGLRLTRIALAELGRLIDVAEAQPEQDKKKDGGGGGGGGQAPQAAFPPSAEIALLAAMQEDLSGRTAAGHPGDLAAAQELLQQLVESMAHNTRPETRPAILLERTRRAMTSATYQLKQQDRGALTRNEQQSAEASLRRLLAESGGDGGGGGGGGGKPPPPSGGGSKPPPPGGDGQGNPPPSSASAGGGNKQGGDAKAGALPVQATTTTGDLLELPPAIREQLRQAREQHFTPGQMQIYQRYLELLEDGK